MKSLAVLLLTLLAAFATTNPAHAGYPDGMNTYAAYHVMHGGVDPSGTLSVNDKRAQQSIDQDITASRLGAALIAEIKVLEKELGVEVTVSSSTETGGSSTTAVYGDKNEDGLNHLVSIEVVINSYSSEYGCYVTGDGPTDYAEFSYDEIVLEELYHALQNLREPVRQAKNFKKLGNLPEAMLDDLAEVDKNPNLSDAEKNHEKQNMMDSFFDTWHDYFEWEANMNVNYYRQWKELTGKGECPERTYYYMYKSTAQLKAIVKRLQDKVDAGDNNAYDYWIKRVDEETRKEFSDLHGITLENR